MTPIFFSSAAEFRRWLETNHATATELVLGINNRDSGRGGITYAEALDEALCVGWIDGLVRRLDDERHTRRFTPRKPGSIWSRVNVGHVERLKAAGRMTAAGLAAYAAREEQRTGAYSFEQRPREFPPVLEKLFRANQKAWTFWRMQPPGYRRTFIWWVVSAKRPETRRARLAALIGASAARRRIDRLRPPKTESLPADGG
jgi:uncharacterized protein YdeI (YjbR/CyaY-like superfamily)